MANERKLLLAVLIGWAVIATLALIFGPPLGHDEAQYALAARGDVPSGPWLYLPPGTIAIARIGIALGEQPWILRLASTLLGFGIPLATWALGRAAFGERTGAWAAAVIATSHQFALHSAELLSDLPAAACVVAGIAVIARELSRDEGPSWWIVAAAPAWAAAFYLRYGHAPVMALAGLAACALWWRRILARPLPVLATAVAFALLLVPHALYSLDKLGSVLGILQLSRSAPAKEYIGEGLVTYLTSNPLRFYGFVVTPVMLAGLASIVLRDSQWRLRVFLASIAVGQVVAIGLQTRAQPRYVYIAVILLVVLGVDAIAKLASRLTKLPRAVPYVIAFAAWLGALVVLFPALDKRKVGRAPIVAASEAIVRDAAGRPCYVVTQQLPQFVLATHCDAGLPRPPHPAWPADRRIYLVSLPEDVPDVAALRSMIGGTPRELPVSAPRTFVWYIETPDRPPALD